MLRHRALKITHVVLQLDMGGMEKLLVEFAKHADRARFALHFVSIGSRGKLAAELENLGWPVAALEEPPGLRPGLVMRLARVFHAQGADVIHAHNIKPVIYGTLAARLVKVPVVVHTRHGQQFDTSPRAKRFFRFLSGLTDAVVGVSEDCTRLSAQEGVSEKKLHTIRNGIDTQRFGYVNPCPRGPVVMVGRLCLEKDVATLLRAAALVVRELPTFRLEIAGDGPCMPSLRALTDELGLGECVRFLGEIRDVPALLRRASLFALSSFTEGISLTVLEAMAAGLPVLTTSVGGNPEVVVQGKTGLLVPARDPGALANGMLRILRDPGYGEILGRAGRERVETCFDVRGMVAAYESLYLQLLGVRNQSARRKPARLQTTACS